MLDIMLDTETFGTNPGCPVVAIGAVEFDLHKVELGERFYATLDLTSGVQRGLVMDPGTVAWWLRQSDAVRAAAHRPQFKLADGLQVFADWLATCGPTNELRIWGNDPAFDNAIMQSAFAACGMQPPWKFWNNRCLRTYRAMWPSIVPDERAGTFHNALDDAIYQAEHMLKIRRTLNARKQTAA